MPDRFFDFDRVIDRRGSDCSKWDTLEKGFGLAEEAGLDEPLAMWVADMDFQSPPCVAEAVEALAKRNLFGYPGDNLAYRQAISGWMGRRHGWDLDPDHIATTHGLVHGTAQAIDAFTEKGDGVVMFTPIYHCFFRVINGMGRRLVDIPMQLDAGRFHLDREAAEAAMTGKEKMLIFCSPHNPGGRVWTRDELAWVADFAERHDLLIVCDEIHHDLIFPSAQARGVQHLAMAAHFPEISHRLITLTAASKTFNLAAGYTGNVIIEGSNLRKVMARHLHATGVSPNIFGMEITRAAYTDGAPWLDALLVYLDENRALFEQAMDDIPGIAPIALDATYLSLIDMRGTGLSESKLDARIQQGARIAANHGPSFGNSGLGMRRFNLACPKSRVEEAIKRLQNAFSDLQ